MVEDQNFLKVRKFFISIFLFLISINVSFAENLIFKKIIDLNDPWGSTFVNNNELLITEKSGKIKLIDLNSKKISEINHNQAQALFVSCTSLPVLNIIEKLEKKLNMIVLSSNQALIWETLEKINENKSVTGFGSLFN